MNHNIINTLSESNLERHNHSYCDEELSKAQRVQQFVQDQILFMTNKRKHDDSVIEQDYENSLVSSQYDNNNQQRQQQQINTIKTMMIENDRLYGFYSMFIIMKNSCHFYKSLIILP